MNIEHLKEKIELVEAELKKYKISVNSKFELEEVIYNPLSETLYLIYSKSTLTYDRNRSHQLKLKD